MNNIMDDKQSDFINELKDRALESFNMSDDEAHDFAFRVWQMKDWLTWYLNVT